MRAPGPPPKPCAGDRSFALALHLGHPGFLLPRSSHGRLRGLPDFWFFARSAISLFQCTWHLSRAMQTSNAWPYFSPTATTPSTENSHVFATVGL
jgi:hypothetical protein